MRGGISQAGKEKDFGEFRGEGGKEERNFGQRFGPETADSCVGTRRQKRAYESGDSQLTYLRNNGQRSEDEEARFAAGLKVPRCVTRLLGAELMPPSE